MSLLGRAGRLEGPLVMVLDLEDLAGCAFPPAGGALLVDGSSFSSTMSWRACLCLGEEGAEDDGVSASGSCLQQHHAIEEHRQRWNLQHGIWDCIEWVTCAAIWLKTSHLGTYPLRFRLAANFFG